MYSANNRTPPTPRACWIGSLWTRALSTLSRLGSPARGSAMISTSKPCATATRVSRVTRDSPLGYEPCTTMHMRGFLTALPPGARSSGEELADRDHDRLLLRFGHPRVDRQREHLSGKSLRDREGPCRVAEVGEGRRLVDRLRIVPSGSDPAFGKVTGQRGRVRRADDVEVPHGIAPGRDRRQPQVADAFQRLRVVPRDRAPLFGPARQVLELPQQDERLQRVEP